MHVAAFEFQAVDPLRVVLVLRPRVFGEDLPEGFEVFGTEFCSYIFRDYDFKPLPRRAVSEAAADIRVGVSVFNVGFDVIYGRSVREVGSENGYSAFLRVYMVYLYRAESQRVRSEGRTGGEDSDAGVAPKSRGSYGEVSGIAFPVQAEAPDKPDVIEAFQTPEGLWETEFRFQNYLSLKVLRYPGLTGQAEFPAHRGAETGYRTDFQG